EAEDMGDQLAELRDTGLGVRLARGFDGWARLLRRMGARDFKLDLLTGIGIDLDTDPLRTTVRWALVESEADQLLKMSEDVDIESTPPETIALIANGLQELDHLKAARSLFVRGATRHPTSFLLNFGAGRALYNLELDTEADAFDAAVGYLQVALALRPELIGLHVQLADLYNTRGNVVMGLHHLDIATAATPTHTWNAWVIAMTKMQCGRFEQALEWHELGAAGAARWSDSAMRVCKVALGEMDLEEYLAWGEEAKASNPWGVLGPGMTLVFPGIARVQPDPARAKEILEAYIDGGFNEEIPDIALYDTFSWIGLALDDLPLALQAIERSRKHEESLPNRQDVALFLLRDSGVARLQGDEAAARSLHAQAGRVRAELMAGMEAEWQDTRFSIDFNYLEKIATGR
ncbi:MAG: hypothetical protein AAF368_05290, partial [Planctomycetota bacterium]